MEPLLHFDKHKNAGKPDLPMNWQICARGAAGCNPKTGLRAFTVLSPFFQICQEPAGGAARLKQMNLSSEIYSEARKKGFAFERFCIIIETEGAGGGGRDPYSDVLFRDGRSVCQPFRASRLAQSGGHFHPDGDCLPYSAAGDAHARELAVQGHPVHPRAFVGVQGTADQRAELAASAGAQPWGRCFPPRPRCTRRARRRSTSPSWCAP